MHARTLLLILGFAMARRACASPQQQTPPVFITNVTVVRVEDGSRIPNQTIVIRGRRIDTVGSSERISIPLQSRVVDGRGAFAIPGLWDMHVHAFRTTDSVTQGKIFRLFIANGVTGIRDMGGFVDTLVAIRASIARETLSLTPRFVAAGPLLDGPKFRWSQAKGWNIATADEARRAVDSLRRVRVDFLKVYTTLPRDAYFAIIEEARKLGLAVVGHIPASVTATEASNAGQKSFEHGGMFVSDACVPDAKSRINAALNKWTREGYGAWYAERRAFHAARDSVKCDAVRQVFRRNGTWMVPTIVNELKDRRALTRASFAFLDSASRKSCEGTVASIEGVADTLRAGFYDDFLSEVSELHRAGVGILAGTDVPNPCLAPGFSLHDELRELVAGGLSPREALATATINPIAFLRMTDSLGTLAPGKLADLVLLDADPLADIANTQRIRAVVLNGRLITRAELDAMLTAAKPRP